MLEYAPRVAELRVPGTSRAAYELTVPSIVKDLVDWLRRHGMQHEGLFRISAEKGAIQGLLIACVLH